MIFQTNQEMAEETKAFSQKHNLDQMLQDLFKRAFTANSKYPLNFIADEIYNISGEDCVNKELLELRKNVNRWQALLDHLKSRDAVDTTKVSEDDEKRYQEYSAKHELRRHRVELVAFAYCAESENPLLFIANYITRQPDSKIIARREKEDLTKRGEILQNLIKTLMGQKELSFDELKAFSFETVKKEYLSNVKIDE